VSNVALIIIIFHHGFKSEGVVKTTALPLHRILVVANIFSIAIPADTTRTVSLFSRIKKRLLPLVIGAVRFDQINDVELIAHILPCV